MNDIRKVALTTDEESVIRSLKRLAKRWPKTLMLFSHSGTLCVRRVRMDGGPSTQKQDVAVIDGIQNDGGDSE